MCPVCILTDSTAQFTNPSFFGCELVTVLPMHINLNGKEYVDGRGLRLGDLPITARNGLHPQVQPPTCEEFIQAIESLGQYYTEILLILLSAQLSPAVTQAQAALRRVSSRASVYLLDSQTTSVGLGLLVQKAAGAASLGFPADQILRSLRRRIQQIYTIFCVHSLTYLHHSGQLDPAQALIGEMLGLLPFLILENGRLVPVQKARNPRHVVETFYEFVTEFSNLSHLALIQGWPQFNNESRNLCERISQDFPDIQFSEHNLGVPLAAMLGPSSLGLVAMESTDSHENRNCHR